MRLEFNDFFMFPDRVSIDTVAQTISYVGIFYYMYMDVYFTTGKCLEMLVIDYSASKHYK